MLIKKIIFILLMTLLFGWNSSAQSVKKLSYQQLEQYIKQSDKTLVVNFWATWCRPCVAELPYFESANEKYAEKNVAVVLVNLDFNSKVDSLVIPFVKRKNLKSEILHITDTDPNQWINKVDSNWSGAIPATLIYNKGKKVFFTEGEMNKESLDEAIKKSLQ